MHSNRNQHKAHHRLHGQQRSRRLVADISWVVGMVTGVQHAAYSSHYVVLLEMLWSVPPAYPMPPAYPVTLPVPPALHVARSLTPRTASWRPRLRLRR